MRRFRASSAGGGSESGGAHIPSRRVWLPAVAVLALLLGGIAVLLLHAEDSSRRELDERFATRAGLGASFTSAYVSDLQQRERAAAVRALAGPVSDAELARVSSSFGFEAAVLLDEEGRALALFPPKRGLIGASLMRYRHLRQAVAGEPAVSDVVRSAVRAEPIVAFAVPFTTGTGRRVFSGGLPVQRSVLGAFLRNASPVPDATFVLLDGERDIIARGGPRLSWELETVANGRVTRDGREYFAASAPVVGTRWQIVAAAPTSALYAPLGGPTRWLPWLVYAVLVLAGLAALALLRRLLERQGALAELAARDPLTGAANRRTLEAAHRRALGQRQRVAVLAIDLDDFKAINEEGGHGGGDDVLRAVTSTLQSVVRPSDIVARIGGDEFSLLLIDADQQGAALVAQRIIELLPAQAGLALARGRIAVSCSVGIACSEGGNESLEELLQRADRALYAAKRAGKNRWKLEPPSAASPATSGEALRPVRPML
jgi:diguanylate cyclase (GGDEF)-like protein